MAAGEGYKNEFQLMSQDLAKTKYPPNTFYEAINYRPTTDKGLSDGALENIRGTLALTTIPDTAAVQRITLNVAVTGALGFNITNNGIVVSTAGTYTVTASSTPEDIYNFLINDANFLAAFGTLYNIYYNDTSLLFYPLNLFVTTVASTGVAAASITVNNNYIPAKQNLEIIGSTFINNDIYILTTDEKGQAPTSSVGQIWKIDIDNVDNTINSITLIYTNFLNFSTYNAIAPSAILGRYENGNIQRIYWTDNYNRLRSLNVADPQLFAMDLSLIDVVPSIDFDIPLMTNINSGAGSIPFKIGCYQLAYRLSNTGGASSIFSTPSNPIFVVPTQSGAGEENQTGGLQWIYYHGQTRGTTVSKRITWTINNLDRDFTRIEAIVLVREGKNDIPAIYSIYNGNISADSIDIVLDGDVLASSNTTNVDLSEYLALSSAFTHGKTIETKDNRLIIGNVRNQITELDFDARAYRFASASPNTRLVENGIATTYPILTSADYNNITSESDAVAVANIEASNFANFNSAYKYKRLSTTIGGEGPNISYEFISVAVACDKGIEPAASPGNNPLPLVSTNPEYTVGSYNLNVFTSDKNGVDSLQEYPINFPSPINDGIKFPQMNSIYWGYQHNEVYRFGIQFYDKSKNPYFVKWIGDIKFPDCSDACPAANNLYADGTQTGELFYKKSFVATHGANAAFVCQLGLKMSITIPAALTNLISGYSIVRVKREEADKTIVAEGIISNCLYSDLGLYYVPVGALSYTTPFADTTLAQFITPNVLDANLTTPSVGMKVRCSTYLTPANAIQNINITGGTSSGGQNKILKMYEQIDLAVPFDININYATLMSLNEVVSHGGGTYNNYSVAAESTNGNPCYFLKLGGGGFPTTVTNTEKYFVHIYNPILLQYGGNTFTNRGDNEYIFCSHFRHVKTTTVDYVDSPQIFGGDVTNGIMDEERISVQWFNYPAVHHTTTFFYPASSSVNRELRHGRHPNANLDDITTLENDRTEYFYNHGYSCENDIVKMFPKPDPYILNEEYINRFHISEVKINGEALDSWSMFKPLNYWDVEGSYGAINGLLMLQDQLYFIQDKAFGKLLVNPKTAITSTTGEEIQLGRGNIIDSHDYISIETGSKHQFSFLRSGYSLYFIDGRHKKIYQFNQNSPLTPESDLKGMHSWLIKNVFGNLEVNDKPVYKDINIGINGVHGVYDYMNNELIYTFRRGVNTGTEQSSTSAYTLVYNEKLKAFTGFYTHYPKNYVTNNRSIVSADPLNLQSLHIHNHGNYGEFYGVYHDSSIQFFSNPKPEFTKTFNNLLIQTEVQNGSTLIDTDSGATPIHESFNLLEVANDHQSNSVVLTPMSNLIRFFRSWRLQIPKNSTPAAYTSSNIFAKMTDKYLKVKLSFTNNNNKRMIVHNVISFFKTHSPR